MADWVASLTSKEVRDATILLITVLIGTLIAALRKKKKKLEEGTGDVPFNQTKVLGQLSDALERERAQNATARSRYEAREQALEEMSRLHERAERSLMEERVQHEATKRRLAFATQQNADLNQERTLAKARMRMLEDRIIELERTDDVKSTADVITGKMPAVVAPKKKGRDS